MKMSCSVVSRFIQDWLAWILQQCWWERAVEADSLVEGVVFRSKVEEKLAPSLKRLHHHLDATFRQDLLYHAASHGNSTMVPLIKLGL